MAESKPDESSRQSAAPTLISNESASFKLQILLNTGSRTALLVSSQSSFGTIKDELVAHWPSDFGQDASKSRLRFLYLGQFLGDEKSPQDLNMKSGTIVHLVIRPSSLALRQEAELDKKVMRKSSSCCLIV